MIEPYDCCLEKLGTAAQRSGLSSRGDGGKPFIFGNYKLIIHNFLEFF